MLLQCTIRRHISTLILCLRRECGDVHFLCDTRVFLGRCSLPQMKQKQHGFSTKFEIVHSASCTDKTKSSIVAIGGKDKPFAIRCWMWRVQVRGSRPPIHLFGSWSLSIADEIFAKEQRTQPIMRFSDMCTSASNHSQQSCLVPDQTTMLPPRRHCHCSLQSNISKS
jgi:hypothetical protein